MPLTTRRPKCPNFSGHAGSKVWSAQQRAERDVIAPLVVHAYLVLKQSVPTIRRTLLNCRRSAPWIHKILHEQGIKARSSEDYAITETQRVSRAMILANYNRNHKRWLK